MFCRIQRLIRILGLTALGVGIFSLLNFALIPEIQRLNAEAEDEVVKLLPQNHLVFAEGEHRRVGPGEQGSGVQLNASERALGDESKRKWFMNLVVSDKISLDRALRDQRSPQCRTIGYEADLPTASVIIVFTDEAWSPLLRTVHSVFNRTPKHLLKEIVLVDDFSQREELGKKLEEYLKRFGRVVKLVRSQHRLGLIVARLTGAQHSTGDVVVFIDAHCEASRGWIEPLLQRIKNNPKAFVCPVIDYISADDLAYQTGAAEGVGTFWWSLHYKMDPIPESEQKRRKNKLVDPLRTPTMAGGLFAARRDYFFELGGYDTGMEIWGGENLEISFRVWMCGGSIEVIPCSHVGHIYRSGHPYNMTGKNGNVDVHGTNSKRLAEVWMDDYKRLYYVFRMDLKKKDVGSLEERHELRRRLKCHSFKWYLENVIPEKFIPDENVAAYGLIRNPETQLCFDTLQRLENKDTVLLGVYNCQITGSSSQMFSLTNDGILRRETTCADVADSVRFVGKENHVQLQECSHRGNGVKFEHSKTTGQLRHIQLDMCLDVGGLKAGDDLLFDRCNPNKPSQRFEFIRPVPS